MENLKKSVLINFILFSLLIILNLSFAISFGNVFAEDLPNFDETTATVKVTSNGETRYYGSFGDAVGNLSSNSTITLLKDATLSLPRSLRCSIDLNGNTLTSNGAIIYGNTLTILDSKGSGKISGNVSFYESCNITIKSAGTIEYFYFINSRCTVLGGKINRLALNIDNTNISGGEINDLIIYRERSIHLSGGTINKFTFVGISENFDMLNEGYIYANKVDNSPIKIADMTSSTQVNIIECPHPTFTNCVCDYCEFVCEHSGHYNQDGICQVCGYVCNHENHFDQNGICIVCNYVCTHLELDENNICLECNQQIEANLKDSSTNKNYIHIEDALSSIKDGDTLTLCNNASLEQSFGIDVICTIDLCGYSLDGFYINLNNKITITDSIGNGFIAIYACANSSQIELKGAQTTFFSIMANENKVKFYSGKISMLTVYNCTINNILPNGYAFVKHEGDNIKKLTKQETNIESFYIDNCFLTCEVCTHDAVDNNLDCSYCGNDLSQEEVLKALVNELKTTKNELSQAISKKEDISSINEKVQTLTNTISNTETICKAYSDEKDLQLKQELESLIESAKQEAISSSSTALELAKNNLLNIINEKLDAQTFNTKMEELANAITNAETICKTYSSNQDLVLKEELISKINESKSTLQNVNDEILDRLSKAEAEIDNNTKSIEALKIATIILSVLFAVALSVGYTLMYLYIKKHNKK